MLPLLNVILTSEKRGKEGELICHSLPLAPGCLYRHSHYLSTVKKIDWKKESSIKCVCGGFMAAFRWFHPKWALPYVRIHFCKQAIFVKSLLSPRNEKRTRSHEYFILTSMNIYSPQCSTKLIVFLICISLHGVVPEKYLRTKAHLPPEPRTAISISIFLWCEKLRITITGTTFHALFISFAAVRIAQ